MRHTEGQVEEAGGDEATTGFIDIQFGLIAILILALSFAAASMEKAEKQANFIKHRLQLTEAGAEAVLHLLLCDPPQSEGQEINCVSNKFDGHADSKISLKEYPSEGVAELALEPDNVNIKNNTGLFESGKSDLPAGNDNAFTKIRQRIDDFFACVAPLDRSIKFSDKEHKRFEAIIKMCRGIYLRESVRYFGIKHHELKQEASIDRVYYYIPGLDLFNIVGHADACNPANNDEALVGEYRAQRALYALLASSKSVKDIKDNQLALEIEHQANNLPNPAKETQAYSALLDLVPLSARILQECRLEQPQRQPDWCRKLLEHDTANMRVPRIFALSSYGRFSPRFGSLENRHNDDCKKADIRTQTANAQDRRVEFRMRTAVIPSAIHELAQKQGGTHDYYRLYTAAAVLTLHECDLNRRTIQETCVSDLDKLVRSQ